MDHMHHQHHHSLTSSQHHPIHWNYSSPTATVLPTPLTSTPISNTDSLTNNNNNTWTPPTTRGLKRAMSESDCDDIYSEESSKEHPSSIENDSCQLMSRKKRRGVIEKKRRDRINSSLSELKRLVPSAFEKQGSAKLEKAEILQLTVDHLKALHSKGIDSIGFDPQRFAMDYHVIGFRECASEVARYLVTMEGMNTEDPLRVRLLSHLQCFVAQRELSAKSSVSGVSSCSNWPALQNSFQPSFPSQGYQTYPGTSPITPNQHHNSQRHSSFNSPYMGASASSSTYLNSSLAPQSPDYSSSGYGTATNASISSVVITSTSNNASTTSPAPIQTTPTDQQQNDNSQPIYTDLSNSNDRLLHLGGNYHNYGNGNQLYGVANSYSNNSSNNNNNNNNNSKPYRPWHPEMAY